MTKKIRVTGKTTAVPHLKTGYSTMTDVRSRIWVGGSIKMVFHGGIGFLLLL